MSVMSHGWTSREKSSSRLSFRRITYVPRQDENSAALSPVAQNDEEIVEPMHVPVSDPTVPQIMTPKRSIVKLDNLIMETIMKLEEPGGSNKTTIAASIEEQYWAPSDFKRILSSKLKFMAGCGKLIKVKRRYRIAPASGISERGNSSMLMIEGEGQKTSPNNHNNNNNEMEEMVPLPAKASLNLDADKMRTMSLQDAALAVARAVAEAEAAILEAEEANREAEAAEADAEEKQAFAEATMKTLKGRNGPRTSFELLYLHGHFISVSDDLCLTVRQDDLQFDHMLTWRPWSKSGS
ncbi:hypothetical protein ACFE04_000359 [Oxalis oulophora]